jgi:Spy/CpxP family protein refolding chaperone
MSAGCPKIANRGCNAKTDTKEIDMKRLLTAAVLTAVLLSPTVIGAQPGPGMGMGQGQGRPGCAMSCDHKPMARGKAMRMHGRMGGMRAEMAAKLELTDDQKTKMEQMRGDFQMLMIDQQAKVRKAQLQLRQLRRDDKASPAAVEAQIDQVAKVRAESAKMRYRHHSEMQSILTDKQKEMLKELKVQGPGRMRGAMLDEIDGGGFDAPEPDGEEG